MGHLSNTGKWDFRDRRLRLRRRSASVAALVAVGGLAASVLAGCGSSSGATSSGGAPVAIHVGYFPNVTHAPALVGVADGIFARDLGPDRLATPQTFRAGPAENQALLSGSLDIAFEGPSSWLSAYSHSHAVTVIAGAASGGAGLVTKASITRPAQLKGATIASPQLANTQDVALRAWLAGQGYRTSTNGGGDVTVAPSATGNGTVVTAFTDGKIDGAWMPEPYESEMLAAGGHLLVDEASLWPHGQWTTTDVVVRTAFLHAHPATVSRFLHGLVDTLAFIKDNPQGAATATNEQLSVLAGGKKLPPSILASAFGRLTFTADPLASTLRTQVANGEKVGLLANPGPLSSIYDLGPLNAVLKAAHLPEVAGP